MWFCYFSGYDKYNAIRADPCLCFANKLRLSAAEIEKLSAISPEHGSVDRYVSVIIKFLFHQF